MNNNGDMLQKESKQSPNFIQMYILTAFPFLTYFGSS